jgi:hypothetical protein
MTTTAREIGGGNNKEQQGLAVGVFTFFPPLHKRRFHVYSRLGIVSTASNTPPNCLI